MADFGSLTQYRWDCKYHVVFIPKYCKKKLFGQGRKYLRSVFHELAQQKGSKIVDGHMMSVERAYGLEVMRFPRWD